MKSSIAFFTGIIHSGFLFAAVAVVCLPLSAQITVEVTSTGVGIGTATPTARLDIDFPDATWAIKGKRSGTDLFAIHANGTNPVVFETIGSRDLKLQTAQGNGALVYLSGSGNVGIGSTSPTARLFVGTPSNGTGRVRAFQALHSSNNTLQLDQFGQSHASRPAWNIIGVSNAEQGLGFVTDSQANIDAGTSLQGLFIKSGGNVGIGTTAPGARLTIFKSSSPSLSLRDSSSSTYGFNIGIPSTANGEIWNYDNGYLRLGTNNAERMRIDGSGNVGIGTTSPSYKLHVDGTVKATSFISNTTTYADFVFKPDYRLAPLSEVELHIKKHGHLPGIPSEAEAKRDGIDVTKLQVQLLQKVEELTLHLISQEKQLADLRGENAELRRQIHQVTNR